MAASKLSKQDFSLLVEDDDFAIRCLMRLYEYQTEEEQEVGMTREYNDVGFSGCDAEILSSFARQVQNHRAEVNPRYRNPLSPKQLEIVKKKIPKYHRQLNMILKKEAN